MCTPRGLRTITALCVAASLALAADADARKAPGCADGRFVVTQGAEPLGAGTVFILQGGALTIEGACATTGTVGRPGRRGTKVSAHWDSCGTLQNLRLRASARDCSQLRGKLRGRGRKGRFVAVASTCGDGIVDTGTGEECDATQGCGDGDVCGTSCLC